MKKLKLNLLLLLASVALSTSINAATFLGQSTPAVSERDSSKTLFHVHLGLGWHAEGWANFAPYYQFDLGEVAYASIGGILGGRKSPAQPSDYRPFLYDERDNYQLGTFTLGFHLPSGAKTLGLGIEGGLAVGRLKEVHFSKNPPPEPNWFTEMFGSLHSRYDVERKKMSVVGLHCKFKMAWNFSENVGLEAAITSTFSSEVSYVGIQVGMNIGQLWRG